MNIADRRMAARIDVYERPNCRPARHTDAGEAIALIAAGSAVARGKGALVHAILMIAKPSSLASEPHKPRARNLNRIPTPKPLTTEAEAWDNPPRVIRHLEIGRRERMVFLSPLVGRAGILPAADRKRMRRALREAA